MGQGLRIPAGREEEACTEPPRGWQWLGPGLGPLLPSQQAYEGTMFSCPFYSEMNSLRESLQAWSPHWSGSLNH